MKMTHLLPICSLVLFNLFAIQVSHAQVVEEKMQWSIEKKSDSTAKPSSLAIQKKAELAKKWNECAAQGKINSGKFSNVRGWVLVSWFRCAREVAREKKTPAALTAVFKSLDANPSLLVAGPWKSLLWPEIIKARLLVMEQSIKSKPADAWKQIDILQEQKEHLDNSQRAKVLAAAGELSQNQGDMKAAQFFYEQSLVEQESKSSREKLNSVLLSLNVKSPEKADKLPVLESEAEGQFEERFKASVKTNDLLTLMEDCIAYLKDYPGGRKMKWAQDKILDIYFSFFEQSRDEKMKTLKERALVLMEKVDALRLMDWARQMHRRSDYHGALRIAEKAMDVLGSTSSGTVLCYMAGRSAQMVGDYGKAKKYFDLYLERFAGGEDSSEVLFRLGLVHLRMGQPSSAIATFEKLLLLRPNDKYELNARYWLARSFQATNNTRALAIADVILEKYPLSYYGLRLRMERSSGILEWPTPAKVPGKKMKGSYFLSKTQKKALDRIEALARAGWTAEALWEMTEIPLPTDAISKVLVAQKLNQLELFPPVVRLINEAGDLEPDFRALDVVRLAYPQVYKDAIVDQASKHKISPFLVRSLIRQESAFGPRAISTSNAYGLMQLIGSTAQEVATELGLRGMTIPDDVFVPENNIQMGTYYIAKMIRQFKGNVPLGLAAYNAGPHRMQIFKDLRKEVSDQTLKFSSDPWDEMWFDELPWYETSFYVKAILRNSILYQLAEKADAKELDQRRVQFGPVLWANLVLNP